MCTTWVGQARQALPLFVGAGVAWELLLGSVKV